MGEHFADVAIVCRELSCCIPPWKIKKSLFPIILGTRTELIFCGTTLFAAEATTSCRCQHIRCHITPALRQKILGSRLSPCPRRPICRFAYRPALSYAGLSVDAPPTLLPPQRFQNELVDTIHHRRPFVKHFFSQRTDRYKTPAALRPRAGETGIIWQIPLPWSRG